MGLNLAASVKAPQAWLGAPAPKCGGEVTPVPIPNTEVKPSSADGTALVTGWESRSLPDKIERPGETHPGFRVLPLPGSGA